MTLLELLVGILLKIIFLKRCILILFLEMGYSHKVKLMNIFKYKLFERIYYSYDEYQRLVIDERYVNPGTNHLESN